MLRFRNALTGLGLFLMLSLALAAETSVCAGCHGLKGVSSNDMWPNLACQKKGYLEKAMKDFRDGKRQDAVMAPMAKSLSDDDIAQLAEIYSKMDCS